MKSISKILCFCLLSLGSLWAPAQDRNEIQLYHGTRVFPVKALPYTRPPFVHLYDLLTALNIQTPPLDQGEIRLSVNQRSLILDRVRQRARYQKKTVSLPLRVKEGELYARVNDLSKILSDLLGRNMIYEPTSRTLHLPISKDVQVDLRIRKVKGGYRLVLIYSHPLPAPKIEKVGRNLLVKVKASPIIWAQTGFEPNEAVERVELYEDLPDHTTEILFKIGEETRKYHVLPYTPDDPRTVVKLTGNFGADREVGSGERSENRGKGIERIVIDPGHGGVDRGAVGPTGLQEKDVALELALALKTILQDEAGFETRLTREDDTLVSLKKRTGIANNFKADLLISIHVNAIQSQNARGSETYYLSMDANIPFDNPHYEVPQDEEGPGVTPEANDDELSLMLWDLAQTKHTEDSFRVARYIQQELNALAGIRNRGVKQAPLKVLKGATMPAVLIETAFISNKFEEAKLKNPVFKEKIVRAILTAIQLYDQDVKRRSRPPEEIQEETKEGPHP